jgi:hypothetical protein
MKAGLQVFLNRLENVCVVDYASEARLRRVCEVVDADVGPAGRNLVFYLTVRNQIKNVGYLKRVLSLGARPDVPNLKGKRPYDLAVSQVRPGNAEVLAMCRADADLRKVSSGNRFTVF